MTNDGVGWVRWGKQGSLWVALCMYDLYKTVERDNATCLKIPHIRVLEKHESKNWKEGRSKAISPFVNTEYNGSH